MSGYLFEGRYVIKPQALSTVKDEGLVAAGINNPISVAIIGTAAAGRPEYPYEFYNSRDAQDVFLSGPLVDGIRRSYAPGGERGAYRVVGVRLNGDTAIPANRAVQATKTLTDGTAATILLTATEWGLQGNNLAVAVALGSDGAPSRKITIYWRNSEIIGDNLGSKGISIQYTGAGTAATLDITATALTTTVTTAPTDNQSLLFSAYPKLQNLIDTLNATGKYTASVSGPNPDAPATDLDVVTAADIKTSPVEFRTDLAAQLRWLKTLPEVLSAVEAPAGTGKPLGVSAKSYFTGGVDPVVTTSSWQQALDALGPENVQVVVPLSADPTVHAMARTHCESLSSVTSKGERVCIVGGAWGESVSAARGAALTLNSDRAQRIYPGIYEDAGDGTLAQVPPYMVAAMKAGLTAGLPIGTAATYKFLNAAGVEARLSLSAIESLLTSGICPIEFAQGLGYRIVQDLTTWMKDTRLTRREMALRISLDTVSRRLRETADRFIGRPASPSFRGEVQGAIESELGRLYAAQIIVGDADNPAYRNLQISLQGTIVEIRVEVSVAAPANYIGIRIVPSIYSGLA